jgi:ribonuclease-3
MDLNTLEKKLGFSFKNQSLLKTAFTHRSYLNENKGKVFEHNERLEFLGDAVLELSVTRFLYDKFPQKPEGELTSLRSALVNSVMLASVSSELGFENYLLLSRGETKDTGRARQYILANTFESVVGAIYLDQGYEVADKFIENVLFPKLSHVEKNKLFMDAKSSFQEKAQEITGFTPAYKTLKEIGPDHDKEFIVGLYIGKDLISEGKGKSKQEAETDAAKNGLEKKGW